MNDTWVWMFAIMLVTFGIFAELNLLRIFLGYWHEDRRGQCRHVLPTRSQKQLAQARHHRSRPKGLGVAYLVGPALLGSIAHAQESVSSGQVNAAMSVTDQVSNPVQTAKNPFSLQLNLDYTTAYFYHGIIQEDTGFILQPAAKLNMNIYERDDAKIDGYFATWNSFHGQMTAAQAHGDFIKSWYESDLLAGFTLTKGKFSLATQYVFLTSPSDAYETVQELNFTFTYDDSEAIGKFALHPYALLAIETGAGASDGANSDAGTYLELGIAPGFSFDVGKTPVSITFPASVGLSLHDYYQNAAGDDDAFGFAQVGVKASVPLSFSSPYGKWTLNAGVSAMYLGNHTTGFNSGQREVVIGTVGLQLNF